MYTTLVLQTWLSKQLLSVHILHRYCPQLCLLWLAVEKFRSPIIDLSGISHQNGSFLDSCQKSLNYCYCLIWLDVFYFKLGVDIDLWQSWFFFNIASQSNNTCNYKKYYNQQLYWWNTSFWRMFKKIWINSTVFSLLAQIQSNDFAVKYQINRGLQKRWNNNFPIVKEKMLLILNLTSRLVIEGGAWV